MPIFELSPGTTPYDYMEEDDSVQSAEWLEEEEDEQFSDLGVPEGIRPSEFVEFAVYMPGGGELQRFSFNDRRYLKTIYNSPAKRKLLMAGRQVEKSTLLGNENLAYMAITNYFRCLYVSPSNTQTKVFSRDRIQEPIDTSPVLSHFTNGRLLKNVLEKKFVNGSQITMRFAFLNADRCRGIPADKITIDEFQDVLLDNVPVIEECASHSEYKLFTYAGTPKSLDNAIEHYWSRFSTQNEWSVPCKKHGTPKDPSTWFWNLLGEDSIGDDGLICTRCGAPISPRDPDCSWVSLNPNPKVEKPYEGYRIPQLMVPWIDFSDIKDKQKKYSRAKFHNEVLGRSFDSGTRPLTRGDMIRNSWADLSMTYYREVIQYCQQYPVFMGLDWGCHDDQTRILTPRGFVPFKDLTDEDEVAQFDPESRQMSFVKPLVRTVREWNEDLLHFESDNVDMLLTYTHRMLFRYPGSQKWEVASAGGLTHSGVKVLFAGGYIGGGSGDDLLFDTSTVRRVPYKGKVYCCKVPTGFIVTERNGKVAYQGNTGEGTFTVMSLGGYLPFAPEHFTYFYLYRFEGMESEPQEQLRIIKSHARDFNVKYIGVDYGGGFWPNDELVREFGADKIKKYQWVGNVKKKIQFDPKLGVPRFLCHRTEVMSDMFNALKRGNVFRFPRWEEFEDPYARDFTNIFSEYNDRMRMNVYKHAPGSPDDTFHSCCFGFLASFYHRARPDVILPSKEVDREYQNKEPNDII